MRQRGYIAILTVIIIMAVVVTTISAVTFLAISEGQSGLALTNGESALNLVEGCAEEALTKSQNDPNFGNVSPLTLTRPEGSCVVSFNKSLVPWTVTITTTSTSYQRTIQIAYTWIASGLTLASWREL